MAGTAAIPATVVLEAMEQGWETAETEAMAGRARAMVGTQETQAERAMEVKAEVRIPRVVKAATED
jgi:hypothetical protein